MFCRHRLFAPVVAVLILVLVSCHGFFQEPKLTSISVSPSNPTIAIGETQQFTAVGVNDDGSTTNVTATWASSSTSVATVNANGLATAVAAGSTTITAQSASLTGTTSMTVTTSRLTSLTISAPAQTVGIGLTVQFTAQGTFADGTTKDMTTSVTWQSSNTGIATIGANTGLATGVSTGTTNITAISGTVTSNTIPLTVF